MAKIKDNKKQDKVQICTLRENKISFNFSYLSNKKDYNFEFFKKDKNKKLNAYEELLKKIQELSKYTLLQCKQNGKILGCEPIHYKSFNESFKSILDNIQIISPDSNLTVFRFCKNDYRLICKTGIVDSDTLYVIGFDFDYSAYKHD